MLPADAGQRSIPACAGEPSGQRYRDWLIRVYPRVCGGTDGHPANTALVGGLSPRVRGNPAVYHELLGITRSIPACAGEPGRGGAAGIGGKVYPRVCGGTIRSRSTTTSPTGLSPRVRGNRRVYNGNAGRSGSIPACAGEPANSRNHWPLVRVYPRVCGGTEDGGAARHKVKGLSPRVRGNPPPPLVNRFKKGSIPACAGEPSASNGSG